MRSGRPPPVRLARIIAHNAEQLIDLVVALHIRPAPAGRRIAIVTGPGGPSISAVDALEEAGLTLAELAPDTIDRLREEIDAVGTSPRNPVDLGLGGTQDTFERSARIAGADPGVFPTADRAVTAIAGVVTYAQFRRGIGSAVG